MDNHAGCRRRAGTDSMTSTSCIRGSPGTGCTGRVGHRLLHGWRVRLGLAPGHGYSVSSVNYGGCPEDAERVLAVPVPSWVATAARTARRWVAVPASGSGGPSPSSASTEISGTAYDEPVHPRPSRFDADAGVILYNDRHGDYLSVKEDDGALLDYPGVLVAREWSSTTSPVLQRGPRGRDRSHAGTGPPSPPPPALMLDSGTETALGLRGGPTAPSASSTARGPGRRCRSGFSLSPLPW